MTDEAHLPAQQSRAQAAPRLPRARGDGGRAQDPGGPPLARPQAAVGLSADTAAAPPFRLTTITRRADFLAANRGRRAPMPGFVLLVRRREDDDPTIRLGITVTKKIGGAVVRNRMKRRFRALAREVLPDAGIAGADHVLIGRSGGIERPFPALVADLAAALARAGR